MHLFVTFPSILQKLTLQKQTETDSHSTSKLGRLQKRTIDLEKESTSLWICNRDHCFLT